MSYGRSLFRPPQPVFTASDIFERPNFGRAVSPLVIDRETLNTPKLCDHPASSRRSRLSRCLHSRDVWDRGGHPIADGSRSGCQPCHRARRSLAGWHQRSGLPSNRTGHPGTRSGKSARGEASPHSRYCNRASTALDQRSETARRPARGVRAHTWRTTWLPPVAMVTRGSLSPLHMAPIRWSDAAYFIPAPFTGSSPSSGMPPRSHHRGETALNSPRVHRRSTFELPLEHDVQSRPIGMRKQLETVLNCPDLFSRRIRLAAIAVSFCSSRRR